MLPQNASSRQNRQQEQRISDPKYGHTPSRLFRITGISTFFRISSTICSALRSIMRAFVLSIRRCAADVREDRRDVLGHRVIPALHIGIRLCHPANGQRAARAEAQLHQRVYARRLRQRVTYS